MPLLSTRERCVGRFVPIAWALSDIKTALWERDNSNEMTSGAEGPAVVLTTSEQLQVLHSFEKAGLDFRAHCGQTAALMAQPVPYPYFHLLKIMLFCSLTIMGYGQAELMAGSWLSLLLYAITCAVMIGLQEIAVALSDPFGNDTVDLNVNTFLKAARTNALSLLKLQTHHRSGEHAAKAKALQQAMMDAQRMTKTVQPPVTVGTQKVKVAMLAAAGTVITAVTAVGRDSV